MLKDFRELIDELKTAANGISAKELNLLKFSPAIESQTLKSLFDKGFWHILYIGGNSDTQFGLRIMPGLKWQDWPLMEMNDFHSCQTMGIGAKNLIDFLLFRLLMTTDFTLMDFFEKNEERYAKVTRPFLEILENTDGFAYFMKFVNDLNAQQLSMTNDKINGSIVEIWNHYDSTEAHRFMRDAINGVMKNNQYLPDIDPGKDYGVWQTRLYHILIASLLKRGIKSEWISKSLLMKCFDEPHCIDPVDSKTVQAPNFCDPVNGLYYFVEILLQSKISLEEEDPASHAVKEFYKKGKGGYIGVAHAEMAAILDEHNTPLRSWNALINAAYWSGRNLKKSLFPTWEAAIELCKRNNWADAQYALEYQMGIYKEMEGK